MNLNSLYGTWTIDFTHPEYESNGIFALTGPTGGGKTTILDAVTLALFGSTSRLGRITKSSNEIMSRGTGECMAEVIFSSSKGTFRCTWSQHRARKHPEGNLAEAYHEISEFDTGKVLENKKSLVRGVIEEKTGMDFHQFTRSILLAQGSFDIFLKADAEEKSRILEQITGTEIYSTISRNVYERMKEEENRVAILKGEISHYILLSDEELNGIERDIIALRNEAETLEKKIWELSSLLSWREQIRSLSADLDTYTKDREALALSLEEFKPERTRLISAGKARAIEPLYRERVRLHDHLQSTQTGLHEIEKSLETLNISLGIQQTILNENRNSLAEASSALRIENSLARQVISLDQSIREKNPSLIQEKENLSVMQESLRKTLSLLTEAVGEQEEKRAHLLRLQAYQEENQNDRHLSAALETIRHTISSIVRLKGELKELAEQDGVITEKLATNETERKQLSALLDGNSEALTLRETKKKDYLREMQVLLGERLLREYISEKDHLLTQRAYQTQILDLSSYRKELSDGTPCPLCGSIDHPYAAGNIPEIGETDRKITDLNTLIRKAESIQNSLDGLDHEIRACEKAQTEQKHSLSLLTQTEKLLRDERENLKELKKKKKGALETERSSLLTLAAPYTALLPREDELVIQLEERKKHWDETEAKRVAYENRIVLLSESITRLSEIKEEKKGENRKIAGRLRYLKQELLDLRENRKKIYGEKNPEVQLQLLSQQEELRKEKVEQAGTALLRIQEQLTGSKREREILITAIETGLKEYAAAQKLFDEALIQSSFVDESQFITALLPPEEITLLGERGAFLDEEMTKISALIGETERKLTLETEKKLTDLTSEELSVSLKERQSERDLLLEKMANHQSTLSGNEETKRKLAGKAEEMERQEKTRQSWAILSDLIGSADGKKYRSFAQGLTFEVMINYANEQLCKMSDRYLLIRDEQLPLEVNIMDAYQGSQTRSVKNVSGGESFIISLALALGLSRMASRNVRVDSLFLDEGFGTLDEISLETALQTLSTLPQEGKIIGLISHVHGLKERIPTHLSVTAGSGGRSRISGPGVTY